MAIRNNARRWLLRLSTVPTNFNPRAFRLVQSLCLTRGVTKTLTQAQGKCADERTLIAYLCK